MHQKATVCSYIRTQLARHAQNDSYIASYLINVTHMQNQTTQLLHMQQT